MDISLMLEPQIGMSYGQILAMARAAEDAGLHGMYRSDHYHEFSRDGVDATDAWATIAGLARETDELVLGTLVSPATFRRVGNLARVVGTCAEMAGNTASDGTRIHLGLGTGWHEPEHRQQGFPFEDLDTRFRRMEEHAQVLRGLWDAARQPFDFDGNFVTIRGAVFAPIPQPRPRLIIGGTGAKRTPTLAATYADELNVVMQPPEEVRARAEVAARVCEEQGRDPIRVTVMGPVVVGADEAEASDRLARLAEHQGQPVEKVGEWVRSAGVFGSVDQASSRLADYADAGVAGIACQHVLADDTDMVSLLGRLG